MLEAAGAGLVLMGDLTNEESGNAFLELCRVVVVFGKRLKQAKYMIANFNSVAHQSGIVLPPKAVLILESG
ncbi:hypothetical protein MAP00_006149 [Monascus purpureus]|nr:hypothetical protein MAP00_006149 [Monascus purpureus]